MSATPKCLRSRERKYIMKTNIGTDFAVDSLQEPLARASYLEGTV